MIEPPGQRVWLRWLLLAAAIGALGAHAGYYYPFFSDDALITLRYSRRFAQGLGLTWTDGERVEGYTDLLWVLLNVPSTWLGADALTWARALDFIGGALAVWAVAAGTGDVRTPDPWRLFSGGLLVALASPIAVWSEAGLEHGFMFGVQGWCLVLAMRGLEVRPGATRNLLAAGALGGALVLLRADGMVLVGALGLGLLLAQPGRDGLRRMVVFGLLPAALLGGQLLFRRAYYGTWVPNTALAKVSFNFERLMLGLTHLGNGLLALVVMVVAVAAALTVIVRAGVPRRRWLPPLAMAVIWCAYLVSVGGDIFPGWRQLALAVVPLALLVAEAASALAPTLRRRLPVALAWAAALGGHLFWQGRDPENIRAKNEMWEWGGLPIGTALKTAFGSARPLLAVDAAGALPFWSELPSLDMLGLNDWWIPRHPPPGFGHGGIGHELGDGDYVLRRAPDIIAFCGAVGNRVPCFVGGHQMLKDPRFHRMYQLVVVEHQGTRGDLYFKLDGRVGVRRTDGKVTIPGYLFTGDNPAVLRGQSFVGTIRPDAPVSMVVRLERGTWSLDTDPMVAETSFACGGRSAMRLSGGFTRALDVPRPVDVRVALGVPAGAAPLLLEQVTLSRPGSPSPGWLCDDDQQSPLLVQLEQLAQPRREHGFWAAPGHILFGKAGVRVQLPGTLKPARVGLSVDGNDRYAVHYRRRDTVVAAQEITIRPGGWGLAVWDLEAPPEVTLAGADEIDIVPLEGDQFYSLGHLVLSDRPSR